MNLEELKEEKLILEEIISFYDRFDISKCIEEDGCVVLEMANIKQKESKLPMNIFIDYDKAGKYQHGARIKIQNNYNPKIQQNEFFSLSISDNPILLTTDVDIKLKNRDLRDLLDFIRLYEAELLEVWYGNMTVDKFKEIIRVGGYL